MVTIPPSLGLFAPPRHRLSSIYFGVPGSTTPNHPERSHARLLLPSRLRWNHQSARDPAAKPTREEVEQWYNRFGIPKLTPFENIKKEFYKRSKIYHPDIIGKDMVARKKWHEILDLYEAFKHIDANGHKAIIDQEIRKHMDHTQAIRAQAAVQDAARARSIQRQKEDPLKQAQKKRDDLIKRQEERQRERAQREREQKEREQKEREQKERQQKEREQKEMEQKRREQEERERKERDERMKSAIDKPKAKEEAHPNTRHTAAHRRKTKTLRHDTIHDGLRNSARTKAKTNTAPRKGVGAEDKSTWKSTVEKSKAADEADIRARARIVKLYDLPPWATLAKICRAFSTFMPGAIHDCDYMGQSQGACWFEFFSSSAARQVMEKIESGELVVTDKDSTTGATRSFTVRQAMLDVAAGMIPPGTYQFRILTFFQMDEGGTLDYKVSTMKAMATYFFQTDVLSRIMQEDVSSQIGLKVHFKSVKDAEKAWKWFQKHRPDVTVICEPDEVGSIEPNLEADNPTSDAGKNKSGDDDDPEIYKGLGYCCVAMFGASMAYQSWMVEQLRVAAETTSIL